MGTWGSGPFENDGAGDLLVALRAGDFEIEDFSGHVDEGYLEADDAQAAIALAEIVAVAHGLRQAPPQLEGIDAAAYVGSLPRSSAHGSSPLSNARSPTATPRSCTNCGLRTVLRISRRGGRRSRAGWRASWR
ncbi:hypothetical protein BTZ20_0657 [Rhodococcus sp. MTM3W5.2]|nr:hypothetical protein BTZ20_0657 [Rhodococcus sp. MTM3W5.2]